MLPQPLPRGHCPVCCGDLETELVYCARCHTPHHAECWDFTGRCAIYACSSEQFAGGGAAPSAEVLAIEGGEGDAARALPARRPQDDAAVVLANSKRDAFRRWLRELLDEGIKMPRLWTGRVAVKRRMALAEPDHETEKRGATRLIVRIQLALLPFILAIAWFGEASPWVLVELAFYLGLTAALHVAGEEGTRRELTLDADGQLELAVTRPFIGTRRRAIAHQNAVAAVAVLVSRDIASGCPAGVVLVDIARNPIAVPGLEMDPHREEPGEIEVEQARALARFLGVSFLGAMDGTGRRRRLPAAESL